MQELGKVNRAELLRDRARMKHWPNFLGKLYMYRYDPKHKKTLPYYDRFPLVMPFAHTETGWIGLNFHYINPFARARLLSELTKFANPADFSDKMRLRFTWDTIKKSLTYEEARPCVKQYLITHVRSKLIMLDASEWDIALFLPVSQFAKKSEENVWRESEKIIKKKRKKKK